MAFVAASTFVSRGKLATHKNSLRSKVSVTPKKSATVIMSYEQDDKIIVTKHDLEMEEKRNGFTFYSEKWNGRMAMLGFVIALGTEVINPAHPTIVQQLGALIGQ